MGCAVPQEEQVLGENNHHQQQQHQQQLPQKQLKAPKQSSMVNTITNVNQASPEAPKIGPAGKLKGTHSALVKLLESAPIVQVRPVLKQKSNGNHTDQNHYRKAELGTSKCPWKKSRICAEWLLKNQQEAASAVTESEQTPALKTEPMPGGEFLAPTKTHQTEEDVEMTELDGLVCTCHELLGDGSEDGFSLRRNSSDSTDDDELVKCDCGHCIKQPEVGATKPVVPPRTQSVSDSGCEDSDCAENKITDLCNRFNENLSKEDVRQSYRALVTWGFLCANLLIVK